MTVKPCSLFSSVTSGPLPLLMPSTDANVSFLDSPICPQPNLPYPQYWDGHLPPSFPVLPLPTASEFDCLNLNITVPRRLLSPSQPDLNQSAPVLVFFHGGALVGGSQSIQIAGREIYDPTSLVRSSLVRDQPIIVVTANYRVGPLGFLATPQLVEDNLKSGPAGNYGLHDQRRALEWCRRFIAEFGGDPENITIHGSSAGGVSCHYHCLHPSLKRENSHVRDRASTGDALLFRRAIVSSGSFISNKPMPLEHHERIFEAYLQNLFVKGEKDALARLLEIPVEDLLSHPPEGVRWHPFADQDWFKEDILGAYWEAAGPKPDIVIGAAEYEVRLPWIFSIQLSAIGYDPISRP
jgi:carboxylesterase type B